MWRPDRTLWGYLLINGTTFALDVGLLTLLQGVLGWPLPFAVSTAYLVAITLSYVLNRTLNFHSHAPVGSQVRIYLAVVVVNYLVWILAFTNALAALGMEYQLARLAAGLCEAVYMYVALRWIVFRDTAKRHLSADIATSGSRLSHQQPMEFDDN